MKTGQTTIPTRLVGFDSGGEVFLSQGRVLRGIYPGKGDLYRRVLRICETHDLFRIGIVRTHELNPNPFPELPYEMVLEHERIPFISYPHEWSASMLKDAALFHIDLYIALGEYGLTIKDWHPYNILFKGATPVFVDFLSVIPVENFQEEAAYLSPAHVPFPLGYLWDRDSAYFFEMYKGMFEPYFSFPLYMMRGGLHAAAHTRMFETTLNAANRTMQLDEVHAPGSPGRKYYDRRELRRELALLQRGPVKHWFLQRVYAEINSIPVSLSTSGYTDYYVAKGEDFGFTPSIKWNNKQRVVDESIKRFQPKTLLDIGSNTGWFSILAAKQGCQVVALDIDDACVDSLYKRAKQENLAILPLVGNLVNMTPDIAPATFENEHSLSLIGGDAPLLMSADKRLKCDMVLALGLVHHLVLGKGFGFLQIAQMLDSFSNRQLLVEFVGRDDRLIQAEPGFFPAYNAEPHGFEWYTQANFVTELKRHFRHVEISNSHPDTRTIVVCIK